MISILWTFLIVIGILYSFLTGNINVINESILTNADKALMFLTPSTFVIYLKINIKFISNNSIMVWNNENSRKCWNAYKVC